MADQTSPLVALSQARKAVGLDRETGTVLWEVDLPFAPVSFAVEGGRVFVVGGGEICALSLEGELLWHNPMPGHGIANLLLAVPGATKAGKL